MLFCLMRTRLPPCLCHLRPSGEPGFAALPAHTPPLLLGALYANTHFSINLVVRSETFDTAPSFCEAIYPEFF